MKNALIITGQDGISITTNADVLKHKENLLTEARGFSAITEEFTQGCVVDTIRKIKTLLGDVEYCRTEIKAPVLDIGRKIDTLAKGFSADLQDELKRLTTLNDRYVSEQRRLAAAEEARRQEEARKAEQARLKAEADARAAEEARQKALQAADNPFDEEAAAKAKAEADKAAAAQAEAKRIADEAEQRRRAAMVPVRTAAPAGTATKDVWKFEVIDLEELYKSNPNLIRMEANVAAINDAIRNGAREIPGLRIWSEVTQQVRR